MIIIKRISKMVPPQKFARSSLLLNPNKPNSGFKQSISCKFTLHETGYLEPVPVLFNLL